MASMNRRLRRQSSGPSGAFRERCVKERARLIDFDLDVQEAAIRAWLADGSDLRDAVVFIVDPSDPFGAHISRTSRDRDAHIVDKAKQSNTPICFVVSRIGAARAMGEVQPNLALKLKDQAPAGHFYVCCVAYGGVSLVLRPLDAGDEGEGIGKA